MSEIEPSILMLADRFTVRGSCRYTLRLAEHLPDCGIRVSVATPDAMIVGTDRCRELHVQQYPYLNTPVAGAIVRRLLLNEWRINPPDLIHIQSRSALWLGSWLARRLRCPFLLTVHDFLGPLERLSIDRRWCRGIIAVSAAVKADLLKRTGLPESLITVIQSGVDLAPEGELLRVFETGRVPVVGTAGPLEAVKGFPFFLRAAAEVLASGREVEFVVAGAGPEESNLRRLALELKINDRITFVPNLLDFADAIEAMDIFVLPSLQQGIGTIMLEAMALGRPVIATRVGGVDSAVHDNESGLLVPPSDSHRLAERIQELLDNPAMARRIGQTARETVDQEFNVDRMIEQTVTLYRNAMQAEPPTPSRLVAGR